MPLELWAGIKKAKILIKLGLLNGEQNTGIKRQVYLDRLNPTKNPTCYTAIFSTHAWSIALPSPRYRRCSLSRPPEEKEDTG